MTKPQSGVLKNHDRFGMLLFPETFRAGPYLIESTARIPDIHRYVATNSTRSHFLYPPIGNGNGTSSQEIQHFRHSGIVEFHTPILTHKISLPEANHLPDNFRKGDGAFILRLLEVIYETQLQFEGWWWIDRVSIRPRLHSWLHGDDLSNTLTASLAEWRAWDEDSKEIFLNCCSFFSRSMTYSWFYEKYSALYTCIDGLWKIHAIKHKILQKNYPPHKQRIQELSDALSLFSYPPLFEEFVVRRNNLIHEATWGKGAPTHEDPEAITQCRQLKELAQRCLLASVGLTNSFVRSEWIEHRGWKPWDEKSGLPVPFTSLTTPI